MLRPIDGDGTSRNSTGSPLREYAAAVGVSIAVVAGTASSAARSTAQILPSHSFTFATTPHLCLAVSPRQASSAKEALPAWHARLDQLVIKCAKSLQKNCEGTITSQETEPARDPQRQTVRYAQTHGGCADATQPARSGSQRTALPRRQAVHVRLVDQRVRASARRGVRTDRARDGRVGLSRRLPVHRHQAAVRIAGTHRGDVSGALECDGAHAG